jgi:hypothetical protein
LRSPGPTTLFFALALAFALVLGAEPTIVHAGLECIAPGRFAVVLSGIDPGSEIQTAKVYFRSELYPDFYYGPGSQPVELRMETRLELASPDDRSRVRILIDGRVAGAVVAGQPLSVRTLLSPGPHEIEGVVLRSPGAPGLWSLDFGGTSGFQEGSLRVVQGSVLAMGQRTITFRLSGQPEERLRLRFELQP